MRYRAAAITASAMLALVGCHRASEPPKSLVGSKNLPTFADLRKETILLARMGGQDAGDTLNIEIRPTNQVVVLHTRGANRRLVAQENFSVSANQAERLRQMLWRLRPDKGAPAQKTIPLGCNYVHDAGFDWAVAYVREDQPKDLLEFTLPYPDYCKTAAYAEAQELITAVIAALPPSAVVQRFPAGRFEPLGTYSP